MSNRIPPVPHAGFLGAFGAFRFHAGIASHGRLGHMWLWDVAGIQSVLVQSEFHRDSVIEKFEERRVACVIQQSWPCAASERRTSLIPILTSVELDGLLARLPRQISCQ